MWGANQSFLVHTTALAAIDEGEKYCKCVESAGTDIDAWDKCQEYPAKALEESSEYQKGYAEGVLSCME